MIRRITTAAAAAACLLTAGATTPALALSSDSLSSGSSTPTETTMPRARAVEVLTFGEVTAAQAEECINFYDQGKVAYTPDPWRCPHGEITAADVDEALAAAHYDPSILVTAYSHSRESKGAFFLKWDNSESRWAGYVLRALVS
ncbi:hypothetical protein C1Y63_02065 [Corynebacterium sp. 13CS0277]|uniref:hypothetical protein n=1 Tax=Corynebacterium sp. 13CS0277 TaxID=2071994 RepID=UPI000D031E48|nr:hypothetical protein [Corynebacterium sp. 13CS0277]PRQ12122.1 hypothetical protein C1Y63_02065 [Corynebacterium sp. 13CS0277]